MKHNRTQGEASVLLNVYLLCPLWWLHLSCDRTCPAFCKHFPFPATRHKQLHELFTKFWLSLINHPSCLKYHWTCTCRNELYLKPDIHVLLHVNDGLFLGYDIWNLCKRVKHMHHYTVYLCGVIQKVNLK